MAQIKKHLIVIGGATATGKTALAVDVARRFHTEVISADSRQFYKEMNIGTAKPSPAELSQIPHHFINTLSLEDTYSAGDFEKDALEKLGTLFLKHDIVVMAGGSGLFIRAVCEGLDQFPKIPFKVKAGLQNDLLEKGLKSLQNELLEKDPQYYRAVDKSNPMRIMRALSVIRASGMPFSSFHNRGKKTRLFHPVYILLQLERAELYKKIDHRVDQMLKDGLEEEVRGLTQFKGCNALNTVGYQEFFDYFEGKAGYAKTVSLIKQNSRRYAKRQMTWFRKDPHWSVFSPYEREEIFSFIDGMTTRKS